MNATSLPARANWPARIGWAGLNALQLLFTIAVTAAGFPVAMLLRLSGPRLPLRLASWYWAPLLQAGAGARIEVEGLEQVDWSRPLVLACNHQSMFDIVALFRVVPVPLRFALKRELAAMPLLGWYAKAMGMVFIDRDNARNARSKLRAAVTHLRDAGAIAAFPEGTRSRDDVRPFKGGAFQLAIEAGVPVVPVAIVGSGAVLPATGLFRVRPGTIRLRFGTPIETTGLAPGERRALALRAHEAVVMLKRQAG